MPHCLRIVMKKVFARSRIYWLRKMSSTLKSSKIKQGSDCSKYIIILLLSCFFLVFAQYTGQKTNPKLRAVAPRHVLGNDKSLGTHFKAYQEERTSEKGIRTLGISSIINKAFMQETSEPKKVKRKELIAEVAKAIHASKEVARKTKDWNWKMNTPHNNTNRNVWSRFWRNEKSGRLKSRPDQPDRLRNQPQELAEYDAEIAWRETNRKPNLV